MKITTSGTAIATKAPTWFSLYERWTRARTPFILIPTLKTLLLKQRSHDNAFNFAIEIFNTQKFQIVPRYQHQFTLHVQKTFKIPGHSFFSNIQLPEEIVAGLLGDGWRDHYYTQLVSLCRPLSHGDPASSSAKYSRGRNETWLSLQIGSGIVAFPCG